MGQVHQLIPDFKPADAMGQAAVAWQRVLRHLGYTGEIFAGAVAPEFQSLVRPANELRPAPEDLVLYHHGIASPLAGRVMHLRCRRAVVFHNVTPARFYEGTRLAEALVAGRAQLAALADSVEFSIGVSEFNAAELREAGHRNVHVVPLFIEPERFAGMSQPPKLPRVVSVSRVVPHKRMEDLLSLHEELRRIAPQAELWIVGGYAPGNEAFKKLAARARQLGGVRFLGRVSHAELVAAYRSSDVFVSMSEHEGFGVPLVEAMAAEIPVLAFGAAAVPETMGGRGVVFDEKNFAALAEVVRELTDNAALRSRIIGGQRERVRELSFENTLKKFPLPRGEGLAKRGVRGVDGASTRAALTPTLSRGRERGKRVAIVAQRFGEEINGGAELHARQLALRLAEHVDVEVLTTCAKDHLTWANEFAPGVEHDGPVSVHRFPVTRTRQMRPFNRLSDHVFRSSQDFVTETHWLAEQGPISPALLRAIAERRDEFDAFIFFTYLYAPTVWGLPLVKDKAIVIPTAHDEPPLRFGAMHDVFDTPRALFCNTPEEAQLIERHFPNAAPCRVVGVGIEPLKGNARRFKKKFELDEPYLLYVGRMEAGKGVLELMRRHQALVSHFHDAPTLVLMGGGDLRPKGTRVICTGRVDEQTKWDALSGALAVVMPSALESLSIVTLEAFSVGTPVIGNAASDVVAGQLARSRGGVTFELHSDESFRDAVQLAGEKRAAFAKPARAFAAKANWNEVVRAYLEELV